MVLLVKVAMCAGIGHDPWLVLLAILICSIGAFAIVEMFERAQSTSDVQRVGWVFLTSLASGATIWCTHFVAMLAFRAGVNVTLDPALTIGSLAVAIGGTFVGISVAARSENDLLGLLGGGIFGSAVAAMHYVGMAAYRIDGAVTWNGRYVAASILCAIVFGAAVFHVLRPGRRSSGRAAFASALIVLTIATLHFIGMTAMGVAPVKLSDSMPLHPAEWRGLAVATALVGIMVIAGGVFAALIDRQTRAEATRKVTHMALNDMLTGLPNRAGFNAELTRRIEAARESQQQVALALINLKRFKDVNDVHGHDAGDAILARVADVLRGAVRRTDSIGRIGGDEFVVLCEFSADSHLTDFVERLDTALKSSVSAGSWDFRSGASIGVAVFPRDAQSADTLISNAHLALSRGKPSSAPGPCYYDVETDQAVRQRRELGTDLAFAIARNELDVHFQVQVCASTAAVTGYEALLRWNHPIRGCVSPSEFIPIAEENGFIHDLGKWVLQRACREAASWTHAAKVAVNVSAMQLAKDDLPAIIDEVLTETGLPAARLEIELTETAIISDRDRALHVLKQLKSRGVGVALDDFGTGYSSLETLRSFPFDKIKLDHVFTAELERDPQLTAIIRAVVALGRSLSIPVLAEGVENPAQLEILLREGCDEIQGFLFGFPEPVAKLGPAKSDRKVRHHRRTVMSRAA